MGEADGDAERPAPWRHVLLVAAACGSVSVLCFGNTLGAEFVFDDNGAIVENRDVVGRGGSLWDRARDMAQHDYWGNDMRVSSHKSFRPLTVLSFRLNWMQGGQSLDPVIFHGTNVALHAMVTALLVVVVRLYRLMPDADPWHLVVTGLLFGVHPLHCEAVAGLVGRADVLASLLVLLSLLAYYPAASARGGASARGTGASGVCVGLLSVGCAGVLLLCATLSKETGVTGLVLLLVMDAALNRVNPLPIPLPTHPLVSTASAADQSELREAVGPPPTSADDHDGNPQCAVRQMGETSHGSQDAPKARVSSPPPVLVAASGLPGHPTPSMPRATDGREGNGERAALARTLPGRMRRAAWGYSARLLVMSMVAGLIVWQRLQVQQGSKPVFTAHNNPAAFAPDTATRYRTYWLYYAINLKLLIWPYPLCCDWSMGAVPLVRQWQDPRNAGALAVGVILMAWVIVMVQACREHWAHASRRVLAIAGAIMVGTFLPASNALFPVGFAVAERVLYLPSMGAALAAPVILTHLLPSRQSQSLRWPLVGALAAALGARTRARNEEWQTSEALFAAGARALPTNAKLHYNLAHVTCGGVAEAAAAPAPPKKVVKRWRRCKKLYAEAVRLAPDFQEAHGALGSMLVDHELDKGLAMLEYALALDPHSKTAQKNLGDVLGRKQIDLARAKIHLENALRLDPSWADAHNNLGNTLLADWPASAVQVCRR